MEAVLLIAPKAIKGTGNWEAYYQTQVSFGLS